MPSQSVTNLPHHLQILYLQAVCDWVLRFAPPIMGSCSTPAFTIHDGDDCCVDFSWRGRLAVLYVEPSDMDYLATATQRRAVGEQIARAIAPVLMLKGVVS